MNRQDNPRPGAQILRFPGYAQQSTTSRTTLGASRPPISSNGTGWSLGTSPNNIESLSSSAPRQASGGPTSFAQTIGGGQSAAPLDMSEFPSLSGNAQPQYQNNTQAIWQQRPPVQRPPQRTSNVSIQQNRQGIDPSPPPNDEMFMGSSNLQGSLDDFRQQHGHASRPGHETNTPAEEFPPLARNAPEAEGDLRNAGPNTFRDFASQPQDGAMSQQARTTAQNTMEAGTNGHTANESMKQGQTNLNNLLSSLNRAPSNNQQMSNHMSEFESRLEEGPAPPQQSSPKTEVLKDRDRFGMAGLLAKIKSDDPMIAGLARGQDLNQLGLNLGSSEPLWPSWTGPFPDPTARPLQPDFQLPECYTVTNVHRVRDKLPGFSDETLFWIFYTQPMDILQDMAAVELTNRNWRYHKQLQMWLTKDSTLPEPRRLTDEMESGSYVFWSQREWTRVRQTDFILEYVLLAPTNTRAANGTGGSGINAPANGILNPAAASSSIGGGNGGGNTLSSSSIAPASTAISVGASDSIGGA